jgi:hypothetical protein
VRRPLLPGAGAIIVAALVSGFAAMGITAVALTAARERVGILAGVLFVLVVERLAAAAGGRWVRE